MPTADGTLLFEHGDGIFRAVFFIDEDEIVLTGNIKGPPIQPITTNSATLTYSTIRDLIGRHGYTGRIGTDTYEFNFENGPKIHGSLNGRGLDDANNVDGFGIWNQD
ncbi:hypothetical protein B0I37DRAFT_364354 [Chaetomium sp. MPI-CAGE-AT-0009]|nr:hypothetical protein B0I37DRAFT_364354 [Chaetomium sp. MPI-CAGE-AT-0009]